MNSGDSKQTSAKPRRSEKASSLKLDSKSARGSLEVDAEDAKASKMIPAFYGPPLKVAHQMREAFNAALKTSPWRILHTRRARLVETFTMFHPEDGRTIHVRLAPELSYDDFQRELARLK